MPILASPTNQEEAAAVASSLFIDDYLFTQSAERKPQGIEERVAPTLPPSVARIGPVSTNLFTFFVKKILGLVA
jgi:hypothetical protein